MVLLMRDCDCRRCAKNKNDRFNISVETFRKINRHFKWIILTNVLFYLE